MPGMPASDRLVLDPKLWARYQRASHSRAILKTTLLSETGCTMETGPTTQKDTLRFEKLSYLVLTLCVVVLVYVLVARPF